MRDAQTAKPQSFRTSDGWFVYNLAVNLVQMQGKNWPRTSRTDQGRGRSRNNR